MNLGYTDSSNASRQLIPNTGSSYREGTRCKWDANHPRYR